jgi:hypothetical protein
VMPRPPVPPVPPGHRDYRYWAELRFRGSTGVRIVLTYDFIRPPTLYARWWWRFATGRTWRGGTTDKLGALIHAARTCGCTAEAMDWEAEVPATRIPRQARP